MENFNNAGPTFFLTILKFIIAPFIIILSPILKQLHQIELFFIKLQNIYAFFSQALFFTMCAMLFNEYSASKSLNPHDKFEVMALKTILFYSVFTYFVAKTRDIHQSNTHRRFTWNFWESLCKIAIEWAKAIIVILCLRDQGIHFKPSIAYAVITTTYYICSERIYMEIIKSAAQMVELTFFDNLEHLFIPLTLNGLLCVLSLIMDCYLLMKAEFKSFAIICFYFLVYLRLKDIYYNIWLVLHLEIATYNSFRNATQEQLNNFDDVCAVCLNPMRKAKITPCNHYFHPFCLKQCLKTSFLCPICKTIFVKE